MGKRIVSILLLMMIITTYTEKDICTAAEIQNMGEELATIGQIGGYLRANLEVQNTMYENRKFRYPKGYGFAAEQVNNKYDRISGIDSTVVGDNNVKNGPDRILNRRDGSIVMIQDKYYSSAYGSVNAAFDEVTGLYRYVDGNGMPMLLEVPSDQYIEAVELMKKKIEQNKVQGVSNPAQAEKIVKKGAVSYRQAVNIAKAGNIESLTYDAMNGCVTAAKGFGIAFMIDFAVSIINGEDVETALKLAITDGLFAGGIMAVVDVASNQIARTGVSEMIMPVSEKIVKAAGKGFQEKLLQAAGKSIEGLSREQLEKTAAHVLKGNIISSVVIVMVLSADDVYNLISNRISIEEFLKNVTVTLVTVVASAAGTVAGGAVGSAIVPGAGTAIGGLVGGAAAGAVTELGVSKLFEKFYKDDAYQMYEIINQEFTNLCEEYMISYSEAQIIADKLTGVFQGANLKDMYQSENRQMYAREMMQSTFEEIVIGRTHIEVPEDEMIRASMKEMMQGVIYIH